MTLRSKLALFVMLALLAFSGPAEACALTCGSSAPQRSATKPVCCQRSHRAMHAAAHSCGDSGGANAMAAAQGATSVVAGLPGSCPSSQCAEQPLAHVVAESVPPSYVQQPGVGQAPGLVALPTQRLWSYPQPRPLRIRTALPPLQANLRV